MQTTPAARPRPNTQATKSTTRTTNASGNVPPSKRADVAGAGATKISIKPTQTTHHNEPRAAIKRSWDFDTADKYTKQDDTTGLAHPPRAKPTVQQSGALHKGPSTQPAPHDGPRSLPQAKRLKFESPTPVRGTNEMTTSSRWGTNLGTKTAPFWLDDDSGSDCEITEAYVPRASQTKMSAVPLRANGRARLDEEAKEAARAQSKFLRQAALDRKDVKVEHDEAHSEKTTVKIDQPPPRSELKTSKRIPPQQQNAPDSSQVNKRQCPPKLRADHTLKAPKETDQRKGTANIAQHRSSMRDNSNGNARSMSTKSVRFAAQSDTGEPNGIGDRAIHKAVTSHTPSQVTTHPPPTHQPTENTSAALRSGSSTDAHSLQSPGYRPVLSVINGDERHGHCTSTERESKSSAEQKPQSAQSSAALAKNASGPSQAALPIKHEQQRAEDSLRRTVDEQRDADWHAREQAKKVLEKQRYDLARNKEEAAREAAKQRQTRAEAEQRASLTQSSALSTLEAANRSALEKKRQPCRHDDVEGAGLKVSLTPPPSKEPSQDREYGVRPSQPDKATTKQEFGSPCTTSLFSAQQLDRIQAKELQNERLRKAELEAAEESDSQSRIEEPDAKQVTDRHDRPCSLRRAAELGRLASSNQPQKPPTSQHGAQASTFQSRHDRSDKYARLKKDLGQVRPADAQLLDWIDHGRLTWSESIVPYENANGIRLVEHTLRRRYRALKELLRLEGMDDDFRHLLAQGDSEAIRKMCTALNSTYCSSTSRNAPSQPSTPGDPLHPRASFVSNHTSQRTSAGTFSSGSPRENFLGSSSVVSSRPRDGSVTREDSLSPISNELARPLQGGKTLNLEAMQYFCEQFCESPDDDRCADRDDSPVRDEDRCHFLFQVQHRDLTTEDLEYGELDAKQWDPYDHVYDNLTEAYLKLDLELKRYEKRFERLGDKDWTLRRCLTDNDLKMFSIHSTVAGRAELKVIQFLPPPEEAKLPKSKEGWLSTTVFFVIEETIKNTIVEDNFFDTSEKINTKEPVANEIYTARELANRRAAERFVELTFTPTSLHLDTRKAQIQQAEWELLDEIDDEAGELFHQTATTEDKAMKVSKSVCVEEGTLRGPRNL